MDVENDNHSSVAVDDGTPAELESSNVDSLEVLSSKEDEFNEAEKPEEILTKINLDLAYSAEKLVNFNVLAIHVSTRESDFEAFLLEEEPTFGDSAHTALEFDILSAILESEVNVLKKFVSSLQNEVTRIRNKITSCKKLDVCEELLNQSLDQLTEIKEQSSNFQRIIWNSGKHDKDMGLSESTSLSDPNTKIKMQTTEQQRHILRLLEKSLATELDLEKKLHESKQSQELLNLRLQEELVFVEDEVEAVWERSFRAENYSEVLLGTSKELLNRLQAMQLTLNGVTQREESLNTKLQDYSALMETKDHKLLEQERTIEHLREANIKLEEGRNQLKSGIDSASNKVEQLERLLQAEDIRLEHAVASADASLEKQAMLNSTIKDMDNLITTLKSKVSSAENQIESVEDKCIILSETNAVLMEESSFLRGRIGGLEASLHEFEKQKMETTKDIRLRTKFIADLVSQLALERERLHKQICLLTNDKKVMQNYFKKIQKKNPCAGDDHEEPAKATSEPDITSQKSKNEVTDISGTNSEAIKASRDISENENVRNIDAWQMNFKYILFPLLAFLISAGVAFWFEYQSG